MPVSLPLVKLPLSSLSLRWVWLFPLVLQGGVTLGFIAKGYTSDSSLLAFFTVMTLIVTGVSFLAAQWVSQQMRQLSQVSQALIEGKEPDVIPASTAIAELKGLVAAINQLSAYQYTQNLYQQLVQSQTDFILRSEPDTTITFANEALCRALGCSLEEVIGRKWLDFAHPDDLEQTIQKISDLNPENSIFIAENRDQRADGQLGWTQWINQGEFNNQGELIEIQSVGRDITALKQIEAQLRESEARFQKIAEITPSLIYIYDHIEQRNLYANRSVAEVLGYSPEEIKAMGTELFPLICHPEDLPKVYEALQKTQTLLDDEVIELEYRVIDSQGNWHWLLTRDIVFLRTTEGRVWQTLGNSQDITDWVESENRLTRLAFHIPGMIAQFRMRADGSFHFPYASEGIKDIYGLTPQSVKEDAAAVFARIHSDDFDGVYQSILDSAANLTPWHREYRVSFKDGRVIWVVGASTPLRQPDGSIIWYGYVKDISERKRSELVLQEAQTKLQQANLELEKLANLDGLTHIANRRSFDRRLEQEWQRLHREQKPLSLLFFDVDYFKNYNDLYGHPQGDDCLIKIAQMAQKIVGRSSDLVARIGGEEFAAILPNTDLDGAMAIAERIRSAVEALGLVHQDSRVSNHVTISLGVSSQVPDLKNSPTILMTEADRALYSAKQQGRNRVVFLGKTPSSAEVSDVES